MQGAVVAIKELARTDRVRKTTTMEKCREREVQVLGDQQVCEELQELCARLEFAVGGRMKGRDRLKAPGPRWHPTPCGFEPLPPCAPERAPPTKLEVGWRKRLKSTFPTGCRRKG